MKQKTKNKITFEVRIKIENLVKQLPQVPFFIPGKNGHVVQRIATGQRVSGESLVGSKFAEEQGENFNPKGQYVQRGEKVRMMNHKVNLNKVFQDNGDAGVEGYVAYVMEIDKMINQINQPKAEVKQPEHEVPLPPITDAEAEVLIEEGKINDELQASKINESENKIE